MKIHTDDTVKIIAGKDKGKEGKILRVLPDANKVVVEWFNMATKHVKRQGNVPGRVVQVEMPIHASNVMLVCPTTGKPTRIAIQREGGKKIRVSKRSGKAI